MKECKYCGTEYVESSRICPACGSSAVLSQGDLYELAQQEKREKSIHDRDKKQRTLKKIAFSAAGVLILLLLAFGFYFATNYDVPTFFTQGASEAKQVKIEITAKEKSQQEIYSKGCAFLDQQDPEKALGEFTKLDQDFSKYAESRSKVQEATTQYWSKCSQKVDTLLAAKGYKDALNELDEAESLLGATAELQSKKATVKQDLINNAITNADANLGQEE